MRTVFADTFYFLAIINPRDAAHDRTSAFSEKQDVEIITTVWVLTEVADALSRPPGRSAACTLFADLEADRLSTILPADPALFKDGLALYRARPDKEWSLTDCISFVAMERRGIKEALTGDRHFEQAGFKALLM